MEHQRQLSATRISNMTIFFLLAAPFVVALYGTFVFNPTNADHLILYAFQVMADSISVVVLMGLWATVLLDVIVDTHHRMTRKWDKEWMDREQPTLDIIVTTAGEPIEVIRETIASVVALRYPHETYIFDDGRSVEVKELADELGTNYVSRKDRAHAKSGNLNHGLKYCTGEFFAVFDADQVVEPEFIDTLLPFMVEAKIAMVQSPQHYTNTERFIAAGAAQAQEVFYKYVCPSKNISNSAFCVGTNMIFRRAAIEGIGGIALNKSEDIWTSLKLHEGGWNTIFVNRVLARGQAPDKVVVYFKQQLRWASGGLKMLFHYNPMRSSSLHLDQRIQYVMSNAFFLVGMSMVVYLLFPLLYLLYGIKPLQADSTLYWAVHYLPFFFLYYSLTWLLTGRLSIATVATALATFYPYVLALLSVIFNREQEWTATTSKKSSQGYLMEWIWPHMVIIILTPFAIIVGWYNAYDFWSTVMYSVWALVNMYLLGLFLTGERRFGVEYRLPEEMEKPQEA
ncbi:MAG: glycosyltransferase [Candidatus Moranbacteria bacterium]|nr:glycosyltransferase [Candidatus Moranbacteria bacterium]